MKTKFKAALLACLTLCLAIAAFAFAGCVGNDGYDGSYKVTVQYADGSAVTGVRIQLCVLDEDGEEGLCLTPVAVNDEGYAERQDFIRAETNIEEELAERQENKARMNMLAGALNSLNDRERLIINARRLTENPETLDVLGERLGISRERVRQIENRAVEKMTAFVQKSAA